MENSIEIPLTWNFIVNAAMLLLEDTGVPAEAKKVAREEILKAARIADRYEELEDALHST
jgi:uncharacterized membrane-anchored protein